MAKEILILDDQADVADPLRRLLERLGYRARALTRPEEALALIRAEPGRFSALLTDWHMPSMTGQEAMARARALDPALLVILSTGSLGSRTVDGFDAVLQKPYGVAQLMEVLERLLPA